MPISVTPELSELTAKEDIRVLKKVYHEFYHQLVDVLSDCNTHHSIVSKLHTKALISQEVMVAQMSSTAGSDRGSSLLAVLDKPHKLRGLITAMMEEEIVRPLAEEMTALLSKSDKGMLTDLAYAIAK